MNAHAVHLSSLEAYAAWDEVEDDRLTELVEGVPTHEEAP